jgi:CDP-diacylglycerol--glycerol-3-phosphate 3-phosphatidyltransferase
MNLPNILTLSRIVLIPVFVLAYYLPFEHRYIVAAALFWIAGFTDWLDGYLARKWNQSTPFGAFLDPVADKLMVVVSLSILISAYHAIWLTLPALVIVGREIVISALREWMAEAGKRGNVAVSFVGKLKTFAQMFSIWVLLMFPPQEGYWFVGLVFLYLSAGLTIWSMYTYLKTAWPELNSGAQSSSKEE